MCLAHATTLFGVAADAFFCGAAVRWSGVIDPSFQALNLGVCGVLLVLLGRRFLFLVRNLSGRRRPRETRMVVASPAEVLKTGGHVDLVRQLFRENPSEDRELSNGYQSSMALT